MLCIYLASPGDLVCLKPAWVGDAAAAVPWISQKEMALYPSAVNWNMYTSFHGTAVPCPPKVHKI